MPRHLLLALYLLLAGCAHAPPAGAPVSAGATKVPPAARRDTNSQPRIARPTSAVLTRAPADATVLFDGGTLDAWRDSRNAPARWHIENGYMEVLPGSGDIHTTSAWTDVQLHIEFATPLPASGSDESHRGDSGVLFMGKYEVQVLDSYGSGAAPDAQSGAITGQFAPLVNASLPPGEWQSYDVIFHAPRFDGAGLTRRARLTVLQNGVLVQDDVELAGPTGGNSAYTAHATRLPLSLQDGGQRVRFRNIWIRELMDGE